MTDRAVFNRRYTSYQSDGTQVWLANGAGAATSSTATSKSFTAGENLVQGAVVYVSGVYVFNATAASGVPAFKYNAIGVTSEAASTSNPITVILDDIAPITSGNLVAETSLEVGQYYYLSYINGKLTKYSTASGVIEASNGYGALINIGTAISPGELSVEIQPIVELFGPGNTGPVPAPTTQSFTAGVNLVQGQVVYVSGIYALPASAASGLPYEQYSPIGVTSSSASALSPVPVIFDDIVSIGGNNITAESALVPGQYYFLSKYSGQLTRYSTASGDVSASGGYAALVNMGLALSTTAFHVEIQPPTSLYS